MIIRIKYESIGAALGVQAWVCATLDVQLWVCERACV